MPVLAPSVSGPMRGERAACDVNSMFTRIPSADCPSMIGDAGEARMYTDIIAAGNIIKSSSKKESCDCICGGSMTLY